jgi:DNA-binding winged helix-turn-helix (wHTH) protein
MRVVSKDDLLQEVWGGRIVSEAARTSRINAVHRALGDDGTAQRLVRTFTRKGIRFIGEVAELPDPVTPATIHKWLLLGSGVVRGDLGSVPAGPLRW